MANSKKLPADPTAPAAGSTQANSFSFVTDIHGAVASLVVSLLPGRTGESANPDESANNEPLSEPPDQAMLVGFSGGLDSVVLLHAAIAVCGADAITAVHVNHRLQAQADEWADQCAQTAATLGAGFQAERTAPAPSQFSNGLENWARDERRAAFVRAAQRANSQTLLLAHHRTIRQRRYCGIWRAALAPMELPVCAAKQHVMDCGLCARC